MSEFIKTQNSFANGVVAPQFYACDNINGLSRLENMDVLPGGGVSRRDGLVHLDNISGACRLISFSVSDDQEYVLVLTDFHMDIYFNDTHYQDLITPWSYADLSRLQYAQRFGTMIFVHPDYPPQTLQQSSGVFDIFEFSFSRNDADMTSNIPFVRFDDTTSIKITVNASSNGNNYATFVTDQDFWTPENVDGRLQLLDRQWVVTEYISPTEVIAYTNGAYTLPDAAVSDWREAAFSTRRGWPCSITFHQDRLVFGGSRDWTSGVWMSCVGRHNNFNPGTGLDDEAIFLSLLSQQRQQICTVVSSDNLQILTNVGEWAISSKPLTPSVVDIKQHTTVGSYSGRYLPPQKIEGATVFVSGNGCDIRELSLDDLGENYNANDLCVFAKHILRDPQDLSYNPDSRRLYVVLSDGDMAVLNQNAALGISAWSLYRTQGKFTSVCVCNGRTYVAVSREDGFSLEYFDSSALRDCGRYDFSFFASGLPLRASGHNARRLKLRKIVARVLNTKSLFINQHRITLPNASYSADSAGHSGDVSINLLGSMSDCIAPSWVIHGTDPHPVTVLSVCLYGWYTV